MKLGLSGMVTYVISKFFIYRLFLSPINRIPGPGVSWIPFMGNIIQMIQMDTVVPYKIWLKRYGGIISYHEIWNIPSVGVSDHVLLKQILTTEEHKFITPARVSDFLRRLIGNGLLVAEGEAHKFQRKMLNPAFSVHHIKELVPLIARPFYKLKDVWLEDIHKDTQKIQTEPGSLTEIIISNDLSSTSLDAIGLAGFGKDLHSLRADKDKSKLSHAYLHLFSQLLICTNIESKRQLKVLEEESRAIVESGIIRAKQKNQVNDLLDLMVGLIDEDTGHGFTVEELRNQCLTFLAAGHETSSVSITWTLWFLACHQSFQDELREEVRAAFEGDDLPTYEEINQLPLLNSVCKESLRLAPPVSFTIRINAVQVVQSDCCLPKGTEIMLLPIVNHHSTEIWGEDAEEFNPHRWLQDDFAPNPYQYMPFSAGSHQCIGMKFALIEMKIAVALLIRDMQYYEKPGFTFKCRQQITYRPTPCMTLLVKAV
ncbi:cytochrome P450 [Pilobolus umbonatus]|nr:cytochrome P450 [Pilobolus umbonatus]